MACWSARGIGIDKLENAVAAANSNTPLGTLSNERQQLTITADTQLDNAAAFAKLIIAVRDGHPVRLGDVTRVVDSVEVTDTASWYDGTRAIIMAVQRQPDANTVDVVDPTSRMSPPPSATGGGSSNALNAGRLFVELKAKDQRADIDTVLSDLRRQLGRIPGISTYMNSGPEFRIGARSSKSQYQLVVQGLDASQTDLWAVKLTDAMGQDRATFTDVTSDLADDALQATLVVDRDKAATLGIGADVLRSTLFAGFGTEQISTIFGSADSYQVIVELDPRIPWSPERMLAIKVRTASGSLVPLGAFARVERTAGPLAINQLGQLPAVTVSYNLPDGVALGASVARIDAIKRQIGLPNTISTSFAGTAQTFQDSLANQGLLIGGAILTIYIVLGILYESFVHPLTILTGLPSALLGALVALRLSNMDVSVIAIIGILMLIGIVKKNGIMMVDVALVLQRKGRTPLRGDPPGLPDAFPPDHDDDACRAAGDNSDRARRRRQRRTAPAARRRRRRRAACSRRR